MLSYTHDTLEMQLLLLFVCSMALLAEARTLGSCFPRFSQECCLDLETANANSAFHQASVELMEASGEAEAAAMQRCQKDFKPCTIALPNSTQVQGKCCADDAKMGWEKFGAKALNDIVQAGNELEGGGTLWWVKINQTDAATAGSVIQQTIAHQFPNWYPSSCNDTVALGEYENMICHGRSVLVCHASVSRT